MLKPLLLVSAIALTAPVLAQSTSTTSGTTAGTTTQSNQNAPDTSTGPNDDTGAVGGNTVNSQNSTGTPDDADDTADHSAMGHTSGNTTGTTTGTMGTTTGSAAGSMGTTGTVSGTGATQGMTGATGATQGTMGTTGTMSGTGSTSGTMGASGSAGQTTAANWNSGSGGEAVQPGNSSPEQDARGIAVMSDPAFVPAGWNGSAGTAVGGPLVEPGGESGGSQSYPACSATVTDNCVQTYERRRR
jgi:hypothetical protein